MIPRKIITFYLDFNTWPNFLFQYNVRTEVLSDMWSVVHIYGHLYLFLLSFLVHRKLYFPNLSKLGRAMCSHQVVVSWSDMCHFLDKGLKKEVWAPSCWDGGPTRLKQCGTLNHHMKDSCPGELPDLQQTFVSQKGHNILKH